MAELSTSAFVVSVLNPKPAPLTVSINLWTAEISVFLIHVKSGANWKSVIDFEPPLPVYVKASKCKLGSAIVGSGKFVEFNFWYPLGIESKKVVDQNWL